MEAQAKVEFRLPARADNVQLVRHALAGLADALGMDPAAIADLKTVVSEACANVVTHAYIGAEEPGPLEVEAWPENGTLVVTVRDFGTGIRPLADVEQRSLRLGLPLIAALTAGFEIRGDAEQGTEVTMRLPLTADRTRVPPAPASAPAEEIRITLPAGQLLAPVLSRVISMFASRADLSLDRLSDAVLLSDALSAQKPESFPGETARIVVQEDDQGFDVRLGPLPEGGGQRLLEGLRIPALDATLATLAEDVRVEADGEGELLWLRIGAA